MAISDRQRQKKVERRKQKARKRISRERGTHDLPVRIERSIALPILECLVGRTLWDCGIANVVVSRLLGSGKVAFSAFLIDAYCMGVKDAMYDIVPRSRYDWLVREKLFRDGGPRALSPAAARKLVEGAVEYAHDVGIPPHSDYRIARLIFGHIDSSSCREKFEFGKRGKPFFVAGPHDGPQRCDQIIAVLRERCGPDGFEHVVPLSLGGIFQGRTVVRLRGEDFEEFDELEEDDFE